MKHIIEIFKKDKNVNDYLSSIRMDTFSVYIANSQTNHTYLATYLAFLENNDTIVYIAPNVYKASVAYENFCMLAGYENVSFYAVDEVVSLELVAASGEFRYERIHTLNQIVENKKQIIVAHIHSILRPLIPRNVFEKSIITFQENEVIDLTDITYKLINIGYKKVTFCESSGEFSIRGGIIDVFPIFLKKPIRIELFDNEIEQLKEYDPGTQKSINRVNEIKIYPFTEIIYEISKGEEVIKTLESNIQDSTVIAEDITNIEQHNNLERINKYIKYFYPKPDSILDYITNKCVVYEDYNSLKDSYSHIVNDLENIRFKTKLDLLYYFDFHYLNYEIKKKLFFANFSKTLNDIKLTNIINFDSYLINEYKNNLKFLINDLRINSDKTFVLTFSELNKLKQLQEVFKENDLKYIYINDIDQIVNNKINIIMLSPSISFGFISNKLEVIDEKDIYSNIRFSKVKYRSTYQNTLTIKSKDDLKIGDYVVHFDYGIAMYLGIKTDEIDDLKNDYLNLQFENINLLMPVENITALEKYQGSEGTVPKLTKVGTTEWATKKAKAKKKIESIARDLVKLQAIREENKGFLYPKDDEMQIDFENNFEYTETKDQMQAILDIKKDMEDGKIVDRLVCGDVGYGKTEIAMRAAFKTIMGKKQTAYLAPTTILSRQHYYTFKERFDRYGIRVEMLNRLVSTSKQNEIIRGLKEGTIDVVIGTHRLLSEDVKFVDLGLLVVDEEQRFGVLHKEKIKKYKNVVNVLTLTATPIPRTLQMSLMGVRQFSLIETPPVDRYPIQTYVLEENDIVVKEAIYRELARGGQVFYLHNKISDLERYAKKVQRLVPEARVISAHGRMDKELLEDTIQAFIDKKYDVLICTTIIETGVDIPNSNTLIVDNADRLGLAQLYQIRGRVGRSDKVAYAYLMYEESKVLTEASAKRLSAIKEFTNLGSGYKIAVRDLAIRGAGDILGEEQSGFIDMLGMDMYMRLLNDAIFELQGQKEKEQKRVYDIPIAKYVEEGYVSDDAVKILIHQKINMIESLSGKEELIKELADRFGTLTKDIEIYIEERYLEILLRKYKVKDIYEGNSSVSVIFSEEGSNSINSEKMFMKSYELNKDITFEYKRNQLYLRLPKKAKDKTWIIVLSKLLESI